MLEGIKRAFRGVAERIETSGISEKDLEQYREELVLNLIANDVAVEVAEEIGRKVAETLRSMRFKRFGDRSQQVKEVVRKAIESIIPEADLEKLIEEMRRKFEETGKPYVILFVGPNGSGKTTTIVKFAVYLKERGLTPLIAAADTFRAGAIEQVKKLADRAEIRVVSQRYGADSAAVARDAVDSARASGLPVVLIDTAGRTEVDRNLLEEMRKIKRVVNPDSVIYVGDALAGNVVVEQARKFDEYVGIDYVVLAKLDADAKGGSALSISHVIGKPIIFVGVGQEFKDLKPFNREFLLNTILA